MSSVLNFGSINIDHVYRVDHFVRPGETLNCRDYHRFAGGKGLNQSIALAQAGACVVHAGKLGAEDGWLKVLMEGRGVDTRFVEMVDGPSGHAVIQVNSAGENAIVIVGGANRLVDDHDVRRIVAGFGQGDYLLVQNEVSAVPRILQSAKAQGMTVVFNPAPMTPEVLDYPLDRVDLFIVNTVEAYGLTGESEPEQIMDVFLRRYPTASMVLTLGSRGAVYCDAQVRIHQPAEQVHAVDTTGAGDTFIGFFLAELIRTADPKQALAWAGRAAALCVTRHGAADSIPHRAELETPITE